MPPHALTPRRRFRPCASWRSPPRALTPPNAWPRQRRALADELPRLGKRQGEALHLLKGAPDGLPTPELTARGISSAAVIAAQDAGTGQRFARARSIAIRSTRGLRASRRTAIRDADARTAARARHAAAAGGARSVPRRAPARRHRQRQDRGLSAPRRRGPAAGRGVLMLVPEIALTPAVAALFRARFGAARRHSAQRAVRRRAARSVASHPPRRRRRRHRHAVGDFRAAGAPRPDHRRRRARHVVQAGRDAALSRPRRRGHARQVRRRAGRARIGDAVDGVVLQRAAGSLHAGDADARVLDRPLASVTRRQHARGVRRRGADVILAAPLATAMQRAARARRAGARAAQPPRLRGGGVLPPMRRRRSIARTAACR